MSRNFVQRILNILALAFRLMSILYIKFQFIFHPSQLPYRKLSLHFSIKILRLNFPPRCCLSSWKQQQAVVNVAANVHTARLFKRVCAYMQRSAANVSTWSKDIDLCKVDPDVIHFCLKKSMCPIDSSKIVLDFKMIISSSSMIAMLNKIYIAPCNISWEAAFIH